MSLDPGDLRILRALQTDSHRPMKELALETRQPVTTVHSKVKRLEGVGVIKGYGAFLDPAKLDRAAAAFILVSFAYRQPEGGRLLSQRETAREIARFPEV